ncbi:MAG: AhpC/TSA family protein [Tidjanibacter sp.]|nr:AhpC/TSA family protein [Tidjanibacter sp.]
MKKLFFVALASLAMVACNSAQTYTIKGNLEGAEGTIALTDMGGKTITQGEIVDGSFELTYESETPFAGYLRLGADNFFGAVYADEVLEITVSGTPEQPQIEGGAATDAANAMVAKNNELRARLEAGEDQEAVFAEYQEFIDKLKVENKDNLYGVVEFLNTAIYEMEPQEVLDKLAELPEKYAAMPMAQTTRQRAENMLKLSVGNPCIEIVAPNVDGEQVKLSDVYKANKYTLIDFWASWCGPCMGEVPYLTADYAKYHDLGFEIFGVSLDQNREAWVKAIENKGLVWVNVSNLQAWAEPAAADYAVVGIPANFLVDSEGTIVAKDLRGEALGEKLKELLEK